MCLWRACCTLQNWKRRAELIKGNVGWLDNLKISLIMCKLPKRSIWCHCYTDGKDLTDVPLLTFLSSSIWPGGNEESFKRKSENCLWHKLKDFGSLWRCLKNHKAHTIHHLPTLTQEIQALFRGGERKIQIQCSVQKSELLLTSWRADLEAHNRCSSGELLFN